MSKGKSGKEKPTMTSNAYMDHDKKFYSIEVELLGVKSKISNCPSVTRASASAQPEKM